MSAGNIEQKKRQHYVAIQFSILQAGTRLSVHTRI